MKQPKYIRTLDDYEPGGRYIGETDSREPDVDNPQPPPNGPWKIISTCCDPKNHLIITTWQLIEE